MGSRGGPLTGFTQRSYGRRVWWKRVTLQRQHRVAAWGHHVDEIGGRPAKTRPASGRQVRQHGAVTGVQDAKPERLLVVQPTGVHDDDSRRWGLPSTQVDLVVDLVSRPTGRAQLTS